MANGRQPLKNPTESNLSSDQVEKTSLLAGEKGSSDKEDLRKDVKNKSEAKNRKRSENQVSNRISDITSMYDLCREEEKNGDERLVVRVERIYLPVCQYSSELIPGRQFKFLIQTMLLMKKPFTVFYVAPCDNDKPEVLTHWLNNDEVKEAERLIQQSGFGTLLPIAKWRERKEWRDIKQRYISFRDEPPVESVTKKANCRKDIGDRLKQDVEAYSARNNLVPGDVVSEHILNDAVDLLSWMPCSPEPTEKKGVVDLHVVIYNHSYTRTMRHAKQIAHKLGRDSSVMRQVVFSPDELQMILDRSHEAASSVIRPHPSSAFSSVVEHCRFRGQSSSASPLSPPFNKSSTITFFGTTVMTEYLRSPRSGEHGSDHRSGGEEESRGVNNLEFEISPGSSPEDSKRAKHVSSSKPSRIEQLAKFSACLIRPFIDDRDRRPLSHGDARVLGVFCATVYKNSDDGKLDEPDSGFGERPLPSYPSIVGSSVPCGSFPSVEPEGGLYRAIGSSSFQGLTFSPLPTEPVLVGMEVPPEITGEDPLSRLSLERAASYPLVNSDLTGSGGNAFSKFVKDRVSVFNVFSRACSPTKMATSVHTRKVNKVG